MLRCQDLIDRFDLKSDCCEDCHDDFDEGLYDLLGGKLKTGEEIEVCCLIVDALEQLGVVDDFDD
jgi:hypothetical protein